jgi:hypothetical protein
MCIESGVMYWTPSKRGLDRISWLRDEVEWITVARPALGLSLRSLGCARLEFVAPHLCGHHRTALSLHRS